MTDDIVVTTADAISTVTLNRPDALNSMPPAMVEELAAVLAEVDADPATNVIVLTGAGRGFCAGADIRTFGSAPDHRVHRRGWRLLQAILEIEKPIVARINGPAAGLGLVLALFCDCTIAAEEARLGDPHVSLGLVAGDGGAVILPLLVGPHVAKELLLRSRYVSGKEAAELGMINRAVPLDELDAAVAELAGDIARQPVYAVRATKAVVNRYIRSAVHEGLELSLAYEEVSRGLPEYPEAVARWKAAKTGTSS